MEPVLINATDLRVRTREIMERVKYKGEIFLVQTFGQPTAVIISVEEYTRLLDEHRQHNSNELASSTQLVTERTSS